MRNTLGLSVLGDSLLTTSDRAGSDSTCFKLRSAVLKSTLVGYMGVTRLDGVKVLLLLVAGMRNSKGCQAKNDGFVEDHGAKDVIYKDILSGNDCWDTSTSKGCW